MTCRYLSTTQVAARLGVALCALPITDCLRPTCTWAAPAAGMKALSTTGTPPDQAAESAAADHARMLSASVGMSLCPMCFRP